MGLWYRREEQNKNIVFQTVDLTVEFLDIWLQTRNVDDIDAAELAGVIDVLYDFQPAPGKWVLVEVRPVELAKYISTYINRKGERKEMMQKKDKRLSKEYVKLLKKGFEPTPIMIAGIKDSVTGEDGIVLIDGRHRIYAAVEAGVETIMAYINEDGLEKLANANTSD